MLGGDADIVQFDRRVVGGATAGLSRHRGGIPSIDWRLDDEGSNLAVVVARPDDDQVGDRAVRDPSFLAVEDVAALMQPSAGLERGRIGNVRRLCHGVSAGPIPVSVRLKTPTLLL